MIGQSSGRDHANDLPVWALFADVPDSRLSGDPIQSGSAAVGEQVLRAHSGCSAWSKAAPQFLIEKRKLTLGCSLLGTSSGCIPDE